MIRSNQLIKWSKLGNIIRQILTRPYHHRSSLHHDKYKLCGRGGLLGLVVAYAVEVPRQPTKTQKPRLIHTFHFNIISAKIYLSYSFSVPINITDCININLSFQEETLCLVMIRDYERKSQEGQCDVTLMLMAVRAVSNRLPIRTVAVPRRTRSENSQCGKF